MVVEKRIVAARIQFRRRWQGWQAIQSPFSKRDYLGYCCTVATQLRVRRVEWELMMFVRIGLEKFPSILI